jgi:lia operon protein LiaG
MNKGALLGLALIAIGIIALVFNSTNQPVFNFFSGSTENINETQVVDGEKITSIDISASSAGVYLIPTDRDEITIELTGSVSSKLRNSFSLDVDTNRDKLTVNVKRKSETIKNIFGVVTINTKLEVYIPEKVYDSISIQTSSGKVSIGDLDAKSFAVNSSSGSINLSDIIAEKDITVQSSSGRIAVSNSQTKSVSASASSGSITLDSVVAETMNVAASSGRIELIESVGAITAAASSGSINIDQKQLAGNINVSTSSGRVAINIPDIPSAIVDFKGSSGKGTVNLTGLVFEEKSNNEVYGKVGSGDYEIKVRTSSGSFNLN